MLQVVSRSRFGQVVLADRKVRLLKADEATIALMNRNLQSAVLAVLPLLPSTFTDRQLFLVWIP